MQESGTRSIAPQSTVLGAEDGPLAQLRSAFGTISGMLGSHVVSTSTHGLLDTLRALVGDGGPGVGVSADLLRLVPQLAELESGSEGTPAVAITRGLIGVAATGSVAVAEPDRQSRLLHMLARRHIILLPAASIIPDMASAAPTVERWLRGARQYVTFVTGPSRTADIEKTLTVGMHGPGEVVVLIVDGWSPDAD